MKVCNRRTLLQDVSQIKPWDYRMIHCRQRIQLSSDMLIRWCADTSLQPHTSSLIFAPGVVDCGGPVPVQCPELAIAADRQTDSQKSGQRPLRFINESNHNLNPSTASLLTFWNLKPTMHSC